MKTLYDAHGKKKLVEISSVDIVGETDFVWMGDKKHLSVKIIRMYFAIACRTVLAGFEWHFPNGMKLSVRKRRKIGTHGLSRWKRNEHGEKERQYNLNRPNEIYSIEMYGGPLNSNGYRFDPMSTFKRKLADRLFNTDTPYSTIAAR